MSVMKSFRISRFWSSLILVGGLCGPLWAEDSLTVLKAREARVQALVERVQPTVVCIRNPEQTGTGSGVIINAKGLILTAAHVTQATGKKLAIIFPDGKQVTGTALGANCGSDAGLAQIDAEGDYPFAEMGDSNLVKLGDWCVALGHPGGFVAERKPPVRMGRVWQRDAEGGLVTDCTLIGGDSGGPLFDLEGKVIGIHASINAAAEHNRHISVDAFKGDWDDLLVAQKVWGDLRMGGQDPQRPKLGMTFDREKTTGGVSIIDVLADSGAAKLGLKEGDVITKFNGSEIPNYWALMRELSDHKPGEIIKIETRRGEEIQQREIELLTRDGRPAHVTKATPKLDVPSPRPRVYLGASLDNTAASAEISEVTPESPAATAGLRAGDRITAVDGKPTKTSQALAEKVRQHKPGDKISLTVERGDERLTLEVTLTKQ